jgi:2-amino-4-hydroxy-6-hydroxymethyldihydropteridine diphosphokinase
MGDLYLSLGSNLAPRRNLHRALALLRARYPLLRVSSWFLTRPWGVTDQPWFLNCCVHAVTRDHPLHVLAFTQRIEALLGRRRVLPNGPRTVDIDLLLHDNHVCDSDRLTLPHPGVSERDFMLIPLLELAPSVRDPRDGSALAAAVGTLRYRQIARRVAADRGRGVCDGAPVRVAAPALTGHGPRRSTVPAQRGGAGVRVQPARGTFALVSARAAGEGGP